MNTPSLDMLLWCWYWQARLPVEEQQDAYIITLPNHQQIEVTSLPLPPAWRYSGEVTSLHPATYATEELWSQTQSLEWRLLKTGDYQLTKLVPKPVHYVLPAERVPQTDHLEMSWLLRQGYRIEERSGLEILIHTPRGALRQVRGNECSCFRPGMCIHKKLSLYYAQYRPLLRKYPELASVR